MSHSWEIFNLSSGCLSFLCSLSTSETGLLFKIGQPLWKMFELITSWLKQFYFIFLFWLLWYFLSFIILKFRLLVA